MKPPTNSASSGPQKSQPALAKIRVIAVKPWLPLFGWDMPLLSAVAQISHFNYPQPLGPPCGRIVFCKCRECPFLLEAACSVRLCDCERDSLSALVPFCRLLALPSALLNYLLLLFSLICDLFVHTVISITCMYGFLIDTSVHE